MSEVSVKIPKELYDLIEEEAGDVPIEPYITFLLNKAHRQRPNVVLMDDLDSFLQALQLWEEVLRKVDMKVEGASISGSIKVLPNGRVRIFAGGYFWAMGPRIQLTVAVGDLSERFSQDGKANPTMMGRAKQSIVPWERLAPEESPLSESDKVTIERMKSVPDRISAGLARVGNRCHNGDRLRRLRDDAIDEDGPHT